MLKLVIFNSENISKGGKLLLQNIDGFFFKKLDWSTKQINAKANKRNNHSICLIKSNILIRFIIGDLISIEKKSKYEILPTICW